MHGWPELLLAYANVQGPLLAGLLRSRAGWRQLVVSPMIALPVTLFCGATLAVAQPLLSSVGVASGSALELWLGVGFTAVTGFAAGLGFARRGTPAVTYLRGAMVAAAQPATRRRGSGAGAGRVHSRSPALTLAGVPLTADDEVRHFKLIGATGTGKSTAIRELIGGALARGDRAVIADPDGGYLGRFYQPRRGDVILNPLEPASVRWDLFGELAEDYDVEQLARSLIPDHDGPDRSWRGYARTFFSAVTAQARAAGVTDIRELYRLLVVAGSAELRKLVAGTQAQPFLEEHNGRMFDSIRSVTSSAVAALEYVARRDGVPFSVRRWTQDHPQSSSSAAGRSVLFIPYRAGQIAALRSIVSAWLRLAIFEAMNRETGASALWFVVDELDALGQIDGLKDALARLRKFGGRCVLGFQSIAQVSSTYGPGEAQTIVENCGNTLILRCGASEHGGTSQFASRLIGQREVLRTTVSRSRSPHESRDCVTRSQSVAIEAAVLGSEVERLADLEGYLKLASQPDWLRVAFPRPAAALRASGLGAGRAPAPDSSRTPDDFALE
jgi:hypothetical protein